MSRWLFVAPLLAFAGLVTAFAVGLTRDPAALESAMIGKAVPQFALPGLEASAPGFGSAALRGEPRVVNFFASWCAACRVEHPLFLRLQRAGVPLHGIAWKDAPADAAAYLRREGDPFVATAADVPGRVGIDMGLSGVPETFVLDARGIVRMRHTGPVTDAVWREKFEPLLAALRTERA